MSRERNVEALRRHAPEAEFTTERDYLGLGCSCGKWSEDADIGSFAEHQASAGIGSADALTDEVAWQMVARASDAYRRRGLKADAAAFLRAALARAFGKEDDDG